MRLTITWDELLRQLIKEGKVSPESEVKAVTLTKPKTITLDISLIETSQ